MKGIFRMQSRSEIRKRKQEKQRIILGIIILILAGIQYNFIENKILTSHAIFKVFLKNIRQ